MRALALGVLLALALTARADAGVDLRAIAPAGLAHNDRAALAVVGDVNGDGATDVATGLQHDPTDPNSLSLTDVAVIAFGGGPPDITLPGFAGHVVTHLDEPRLFDGQFGGATGSSVAAVGDWNGDGLADVAIGAAGAGPNRRANAGSVYVILGRAASGPIDVRSAPGVIRIDGPTRGAEVGNLIAAAGDVDGDGRPDLAIALPAERAVVVRGGLPAGTTVDLAHPPAGATIAIRGLNGGTQGAAGRRPRPEAFGFAPAGDVDGDGRGELLVGVPSVDPFDARGRAFVLRGAAPGATIDATKTNDRIARVLGPRSLPGFGTSVAALPDSDGDGQPEWIIGAPVVEGSFGVGGDLPSGAFVVFSRARGDVRPGRAKPPVVRFDTDGRGESAGRAVAGIPDVTGDGVPDVLIGLPNADPSCRAEGGAIALVAGRRTPGTVRVGRRTPRVDGPHVRGTFGNAIAVGAGELLAGARAYQNSGQLGLWRIPLSALATPSPALPERADCLSVTVPKRTRAQLLRNPVVRVTVRSNAGDDRAHRLRLRFYVNDRKSLVSGRLRIVKVPTTGTRRVTLRLSRRAVAVVARGTLVAVGITAEQLIGSGSKTTEGAFSGDGLVLQPR